MIMMTEYLEQTSSKKLPVIFGEKVILVPFFALFDMDDFIRLHREDRRGFMCRFCLKNLDEVEAENYIQKLIDEKDLFIWNVTLKNTESLRAGFIYLTSVSGHSVSINGIMDRSMIRKLSKEERRDKFDMTDDAARALMRICFDNGFIRIEGDAIETDKEALKLHKRLGFVQEGRLRKAVCIDGKYLDLILVSILKEDWDLKGVHQK